MQNQTTLIQLYKILQHDTCRKKTKAAKSINTRKGFCLQYRLYRHQIFQLLLTYIYPITLRFHLFLGSKGLHFLLCSENRDDSLILVSGGRSNVVSRSLFSFSAIDVNLGILYFLLLLKFNLLMFYIGFGKNRPFPFIENS